MLGNRGMKTPRQCLAKYLIVDIPPYFRRSCLEKNFLFFCELLTFLFLKRIARRNNYKDKGFPKFCGTFGFYHPNNHPGCIKPYIYINWCMISSINSISKSSDYLSGDEALFDSMDCSLNWSRSRGPESRV